MLKTAILYQAEKPPEVNGIIKPMKLGGYSDSGADIAFALKKAQIPVITPVENPQEIQDMDWVFPDTKEGIEAAISKGAEILWLNTVLYKGHPVEEFIEKRIAVIGQIPENVEVYDDKWFTGHLLQSHYLPIPQSVLVSEENKTNCQIGFLFPVVVKPIRGRGSQGVYKVDNQEELEKTIDSLLQSKEYGTALYVEEYLPGEELTLTIMPPGTYFIDNKEKKMLFHWSLPPVHRFNHQNGIAPYSGVVAVIDNSTILSETEINTEKIEILRKECERAAELVQAKAPVRIDCRADNNGNYYLFDLNMKPNMTGSSRSHRKNQDSLTALASRGIGWSYSDLLINILRQFWRKETE